MQVLGIGVDHPFAQKALADSLQLPYPLLSDFFGLNVMKQYDVLYPATGQYAEWAGRAAKRHFFLIDRDGIVRGKWMGEDMAVFPSEEILKVARQLAGRR